MKQRSAAAEQPSAEAAPRGPLRQTAKPRGNERFDGMFMSATSAPMGEIDPFDVGQVIDRHRLRFAVEVAQPLVLISQIQRSGGTLISQLLDGHPQLHAHPGELHIGRPNKYHWPVLDLAQPAEALFDALFERPTVENAARGYQKQSAAEADFDPDYRERVLPFLFDLGLQRRLFLQIAAARPFQRQRDALDAYATSYFNAWLDYQGLYRAPRSVRYWSCFAARLLTQPGNVEAFFADYADGKVITVVRDPVSWFASAQRHSGEYADPEAAMDLWCSSYELLRDSLAGREGSYLMLAFEEAVDATETAMRRVAVFLGIRFRKSMLRPTFNGLPIRSDSSFGARIGVDRSASDRSHAVPPETRTYIQQRAGELHRSLEEVVRRHAKVYK